MPNSTFTAFTGEIRANPIAAANSIENDVVVTELKYGGYIVVWRSDNQADGNAGGVYAQRYDSAGVAMGGTIQINGDGTPNSAHTFGSQNLPSVTGLSDGGWVAVWESATEGGVFGQRFDAGGGRVGANFQINSATLTAQQNATINDLPGGGFVVTWSASSDPFPGTITYDVYARVYNAAGVAVAPEVRVNTTTAADQFQPSVAGFSDGTSVIIWQSAQDGGTGSGGTFGIYGQRLNANGTLNGGQFQVSTTVNGAQFSPSVTALRDAVTVDGVVNDGFVVVWVSDGQDGDGWGIYGQRYSNAFAKVGGEFLINSTTVGNQGEPSVTALSDGSFVVTWDSASGEVVGRKFDATGASTPTALSGEVTINQTTAGGQGQGVIIAQGANPGGLPRALDHPLAQLSNGKLVAGWSGQPDQNGYISDAFSRLFDVGITTNGVSAVDLDANNSGGVTGLNYQAGFAIGGSGTAVGDIDTFVLDDGATLASVTITVTNHQVGDLLSVNGALPAGISASAYNAGTGVLTLSGTATLASYQTAIHQVLFSTTGSVTGARTVTVTPNDGSLTGDTSTATITVAANAAPVVDLNGPAAGTGITLNVSPGQGATAIAPAATVTDSTSADFNGGSLTVSFGATGTSFDQLTVENQGVGAGQIGVSGANITYGGVTIGTLSGGANGANLVVAFNASATAAAVTALTEHILYTHNTGDPSVTARTATFTVVDGDGTAGGGADTGSAQATINLSTLTFSGQTAVTTERVSTDTGNVELFAGGYGGSVSLDGTKVAFQVDDGIGDFVIAVKDLTSGALTYVTSNFVETNAFISPDGTKVAYDSGSDNQVRVVTVSSLADVMASSDSANVAGNGFSRDAEFASDNNRVVFTSGATNLLGAGNDTNGVDDST